MQALPNPAALEPPRDPPPRSDARRLGLALALGSHLTLLAALVAVTQRSAPPPEPAAAGAATTVWADLAPWPAEGRPAALERPLARPEVERSPPKVDSRPAAATALPTKRGSAEPRADPPPEAAVAPTAASPPGGSDAMAWRSRQLARLYANLEASAAEQMQRVAPGPSDESDADYAVRVAAAVRPLIVYRGSTNPRLLAEVEVRLEPGTGRIVQRRLRRASGVAEWDRAVLDALDKAGQLPVPLNRASALELMLAFSPGGP